MTATILEFPKNITEVATTATTTAKSAVKGVVKFVKETEAFIPGFRYVLVASIPTNILGAVALFTAPMASLVGGLSISLVVMALTLAIQKPEFYMYSGIIMTVLCGLFYASLIF
jgi:hypothetical protein